MWATETKLYRRTNEQHHGSHPHLGWYQEESHLPIATDLNGDALFPRGPLSDGWGWHFAMWENTEELQPRHSGYLRVATGRSGGCFSVGACLLRPG